MRIKLIVGVASSHDKKAGSTCKSRREAAPTEYIYTQRHNKLRIRHLNR
jgi:hypothetical protein